MTDLSYLYDKRSLLSTPEPGAPSMKAVVTRANGGYEQLDYCDVAMPTIEPNEVLIKVLAAGMNNTEINTRLGWYSSDVTTSTEQLSEAKDQKQRQDGGWNKRTPFPIIQGTDCCGDIVQLGNNVGRLNVGDRVLVRACMRLNGFSSMENIWMASDFDGAFAQYVSVPASEVFSLKSDWSAAELATLPCAYGTAENMIHRSKVGADDRVLITGASGGVGSAAVQLVKRRGAKVIAVVSASKVEQALSLGANKVITRDQGLLDELGESCVDMVVDNVAGDAFASMPKLLARGGRYASSGAIAGPMVSFDMRDFYLKDISFIGCTAWDEAVFPNLIKYVEKNEIKPLLAKTFALKDIAHAQQKFSEKKHFGNFVLIPEHDE